MLYTRNKYNVICQLYLNFKNGLPWSKKKKALNSFSNKSAPGSSLAVQWLGLRALTDEDPVQSLVGELRSHKPGSTAKKINK